MPNPREEVDCDNDWHKGEAKCDLACESMTALTDAAGPACTTNLAAQGGQFGCAATIEFSGQRGCCLDYTGGGMIHNTPNEPDRTREVFFIGCQ